MKLRMVFESAVRWIFLGLCVFTSAYSLLCIIPMSWNNFIKDHHYPLWVAMLVRHYGIALWIVIALSITTLKKGRRAVCGGLLVVWGVVATLIPPGFSGLQNDGRSLAWAFLAWGPFFTWEMFLAFGKTPKILWIIPEKPARSSHRLKTSILSAVFLWIVFSSTYLFHRGLMSLAWASIVPALLWSLLTHLFIFVGVFVLLDVSEAFGRVVSPTSDEKAECRFQYLWLWLAFFLLVKNVILEAIGFSGPWAGVYSVLAASGATLGLYGQSRCLYTWQGLLVDDALAFTGAPLMSFWKAVAGSPVRRVVSLVFLAGCPWIWQRGAPLLDWNHLFATLATLAIWAFVYTFFYVGFPARNSLSFRPGSLWIFSVILLVLAWTAEGALNRFDHALRLRGVDIRPEIGRLAEEETSLRTARQIFNLYASRDDIYQFLQNNTNLSGEVRLVAPDIRLNGKSAHPSSFRPHIFIFVIDSLRRDYLGVYNPRVHFTPAFDAFASDSQAFRNAFTAYGGTGLSEPAIWAGARLIHKQYVTPFWPMNSLEKLLEEESYRSFITVDVILSTLLKDSTATVPLDANNPTSYKLCATLDELTRKLDAEGSSKSPFFAYTQPQDIHISVIQREGATVVGSGSYEGFYAPYASRIAAMDACFGRFIAHLKSKGLYDNSLIVLTSDHGDSLGEDGRWGHAFTVFPEVLRIPLIMHIPKEMVRGRFFDLDAAAFSIDIVPTIYALMGRKPIVDNGIYGRPLITDSQGEFERVTKPESLVVSSYAPVYGLLRDNGHKLYIVDAVNYLTYYFDFINDPSGTVNRVTAEIESENNGAIRRQVERINVFYGYKR